MMSILSYFCRNERARLSNQRLWWRIARSVLGAVLLMIPVYVLAVPYAFITDYKYDDLSVALLKRYNVDNLSAPPSVWEFPGGALGAVAFSPDGGTVYVPDWLNDKVYVIKADATPPAVVATLNNPDATANAAIAVDVSDDYVYVLNHESKTVRRIARSTNQVDAAWQATVAGFPYAISINDDGSQIYVATHTNEFFIIDTATPTNIIPVNIQTVTGAANPAEIWGIRWMDTPNGPRLYVANESDRNILVFKVDGSLDASISTGDRTPVSFAPSVVDNTRIYAVGSSPTGNLNIIAIDTSTNAEVSGFTFTPDQDASYVGASITKNSSNQPKMLAVDSSLQGGHVASYSVNATTGNLTLDTIVQKDVATTRGLGVLNGLSFGVFTSPAIGIKALRAVTVNIAVTDTTGSYAAGFDDTDFGFSITCGSSTQPVTMNTATGAMTHDGTAMFDDSLGAASCTLTETTVFEADSSGADTTLRSGVPQTFVFDPATGNSVNVGYRIVSGQQDKALLTVEKKVVDAFNQHDPDAVFGIAVNCPSWGSQTFNLKADESSSFESVIGEVCTIDEPAPLPDTKTPASYKYSPLSYISSLEVRAVQTITVTNEVVGSSVNTAAVIIENIVDGDKTASGYDPNVSKFNINLACTNPALNQTVAQVMEGNKVTFNIPVAALCKPNGLNPPNSTLNSAYMFSPSSSPSTPMAILPGGRPNDSVTHTIVLRQQPTAAPIPTLDVKALILLIGLMFGTMLWQLRRRRG